MSLCVFIFLSLLNYPHHSTPDVSSLGSSWLNHPKETQANCWKLPVEDFTVASLGFFFSPCVQVCVHCISPRLNHCLGTARIKSHTVFALTCTVHVHTVFALTCTVHVHTVFALTCTHCVCTDMYTLVQGAMFVSVTELVLAMDILYRTHLYICVNQNII